MHRAVEAVDGHRKRLLAKARITLISQGRRWAAVAQLVTSALSLLLAGVVIYKVRGLDLRTMLALWPRSPLFWTVFAARYLTLPLADWLIYRKLWRVGPPALAALLRKLIYNELLLSYLGDAYFYTWARKNVRLEAAPFGAVKDVAVLSAAAGNLITLVMLAIACPLTSAIAQGLQSRSMMLSVSAVLITSIAAILWRRQIFSLPADQLRLIFVLHVGRIIVGTALLALLWHLALPVVPLIWWLLLGTMRLLTARLPLIPNHDVVFAGIAVLVLGNEVAIASVLTLIAGLIVLTHLVVGSAFIICDVATRQRTASTRWLPIRHLPIGRREPHAATRGADHIRDSDDHFGRPLDDLRSRVTAASATP